MTTNAIITSWGAAIPGREAQGLKVFMEAIEYFTGLQRNGEVTRFATYVGRDGSLSHNGGCMVVEGSAAQLSSVEQSEPYQRILLKAAHVVSDLSTSHFYTGEAVGARVQLLQSVRNSMGI